MTRPPWWRPFARRAYDRKYPTTTATATELDASFRKNGIEPMIIGCRPDIVSRADEDGHVTTWMRSSSWAYYRICPRCRRTDQACAARGDCL